MPKFGTNNVIYMYFWARRYRPGFFEGPGPGPGPLYKVCH